MSRFSRWLDGETIGWWDLVMCAGIGAMAGLMFALIGAIGVLWMGGTSW